MLHLYYTYARPILDQLHQLSPIRDTVGGGELTDMRRGIDYDNSVTEKNGFNGYFWGINQKKLR